MCEFIYIEKRAYDKTLNCYVQDPYRKEETFDHIEQIISSTTINQTEKSVFFVSALEHLHQLVRINAEKTTQFLRNYLTSDEELRAVLKFLENHQEALYLLLNSFLNNAELRPVHDANVFKALSEADTHEKLIELICVFNRDDVENFLRESDAYRVDVALKVIHLKQSTINHTNCQLRRLN